MCPTVSETLQDVIAQKIRDHQATMVGVDLSGYDTAQITHLSQYNLFPNTTVLVSADLFTVMTARPGPSPDEAEHRLGRSLDAAGARRRCSCGASRTSAATGATPSCPGTLAPA